MARDDCGLCFGRGRLPCSTCGGLGYRTGTYSAEMLSCGCSGGYVKCLSCDGTGRRRVTTVTAGSLDEDTSGNENKTSHRKPLALAELQARYDEAVRDARQKQKDCLDQIERDQQENRTRLDRDFYWELRQWVRDLDLEAPGIAEELDKAKADLQQQTKVELACDVGMLGYACSRIDHYRFLMNPKREGECS